MWDIRRTVKTKDKINSTLLKIVYMKNSFPRGNVSAPKKIGINIK